LTPVSKHRPTAGTKNDNWSTDFVSDELFDGQRLRVLALVDDHSRQRLALHGSQRIREINVVGMLERIAGEHGLPKLLRVANGPELSSNDVDLWAYWNGVMLDFSRPGKPTDHATIESFNSSLRKECLNANWFLSLVDAREKLSTWRAEYYEDRPYSSLGDRAASVFAARHGPPTSPPPPARIDLR